MMRKKRTDYWIFAISTSLVWKLWRFWILHWGMISAIWPKKNRQAFLVPSLIMSNKNQNTNFMQCDTRHRDHFGGDYINFDSLIHVHWWVLVARLRVVQSLWNNYYLTRSFNSSMYGTNMGIKFRWSSINCFLLTCFLKTKECIERNQWKRPAANQWAVAKHGQKFS